MKLKAKCVISDKPKFKQDNVVIRAQNGHFTFERVVARGKATLRIKQPWPKNLMLVVRGPAAKRVIDYCNETAVNGKAA